MNCGCRSKWRMIIVVNFPIYCENLLRWSFFALIIIIIIIIIIITIIIIIIVSETKFSIVIGFPRAYLSRNWRPITWVSNYRCPIWFTRQLRAHWWLFSQCFAQFSTIMKSATDIFAHKKFSKDIFNSKICYRYD